MEKLELLKKYLYLFEFINILLLSRILTLTSVRATCWYYTKFSKPTTIILFGFCFCRPTFPIPIYLPIWRPHSSRGWSYHCQRIALLSAIAICHPPPMCIWVISRIRTNTQPSRLCTLFDLIVQRHSWLCRSRLFRAIVVGRRVLWGLLLLLLFLHTFICNLPANTTTSWPSSSFIKNPRD